MYSLPQLRKSLPVIIMACLPSLIFAKEPGQPLPISEVVKKVTMLGFTDIRKIEFSRSDDEYEIKARNAKGQKVEIEMNAHTGEIKEVERD